MPDHIHFLHNKSKEKIKIEKKQQNGTYTPLKEIDPGKSDGPFDNHNLYELRFTVNSPNKPVYFKFVRGEHEDNITHIDGQVGHPGGGGSGSTED